jgi:hypothetical protein
MKVLRDTVVGFALLASFLAPHVSLGWLGFSLWGPEGVLLGLAPILGLVLWLTAWRVGSGFVDGVAQVLEKRRTAAGESSPHADQNDDGVTPIATDLEQRRRAR